MTINLEGVNENFKCGIVNGFKKTMVYDGVYSSISKELLCVV
jgi:hypothetical protein